MKNLASGEPTITENRSKPSPKRVWYAIALWVPLVLVLLAGITLHAMGKLLVAKPQERSHHTVSSPVQQIVALTQVAFDPKAGFPGKQGLNILVMGIDDNWTDQNVLYTKNARTDTLFLLHLDLNNKKATMLSIPRDSYVHIAGTSHSDKINSAYATGGPERSEATFANLTGVFPDYYVVLNIDATKRLVDALGGVDVTVEHQMDYDDNWGHLHIHLRPGYQHFDGEKALGFVRYRHGNHGLAPEDGDPRRIYRQHMLIRAMLEKSKTIGAALNSANLVDTAMSCVNTNLSRTQLGDLAHIFNGTQQSNVTTASLDGTDARGADGAWLVVLNPTEVKAHINWLVKGDETAIWPITSVEISSDHIHRSLAESAAATLKTAGFTQTSVIVSDNVTTPKTIVIDSGVEDLSAVDHIAQLLQLSSNDVIRRPAQPNKSGWTPPTKITVEIGVTPTETSSSIPL